MDGESFWSTLPGVLTALGGAITAVATLVGALYTAGVIKRRGVAEAPTGPSLEVGSAPQPAPAKPAAPRATRSLRTLPAILSEKDLRALIVKNGFFDKRANAAGRGLTHDYESRVIGSDVLVVDHASDLMWQHGGSEREHVFANAEAYVQTLNRDRFAGFADWRLPTVEEVGSLIEPEAHDGFHVSPVFQRGVNFIWTADRMGTERAWVAYFFDAYFVPESTQFNAWTRAVRSVRPTDGGTR